jgi:hypothetical protein
MQNGITASGYIDLPFGTGAKYGISITASGYVDSPFGNSAKYEYNKCLCQNAKRHNR